MYAIQVIDAVKSRAIVRSVHATEEEAHAALLKASFEKIASDPSLGKDTASLDDDVIVLYRRTGWISAAKSVAYVIQLTRLPAIPEPAVSVADE